MTILVKNNRVYNIFCYPIFRHHKQTGWFESTTRIIVHVKNMFKSKPPTDIVWYCNLLIVIANANLIGNLRRINYIGTSVGIIGIRGNNIFSPRNLPFKMMASITLYIYILNIVIIIFFNY
jgi:hypothetical protein